MAATLESTPTGAMHRSRASMAKASGLRKTTIERIWKDFGLELRMVNELKLLTRCSWRKVVDVVARYHKPTDKAMLLGVGRVEPASGPRSVPADAAYGARHARAAHHGYSLIWVRRGDGSTVPSRL